MAPHETARVTRAARAELLRGIYLIVNEGAGDPLALANAALAAGISVIQYRAKSGIVAERLRALRTATAARDALLIVNDDWEACVAFDADGVHLGPDDAGFDRVAAIRDAVGERLIGLSCGTAGEARSAAGADYLGVGAVYATASKHDAGTPIGIPGLLEVAHATPLPVAAIGGIDASNLRAFCGAGVAMAAVISAVSAAPDARDAAAALVSIWNERSRA